MQAAASRTAAALRPLSRPSRWATTTAGTALRGPGAAAQPRVTIHRRHIRAHGHDWPAAGGAPRPDRPADPRLAERGWRQRDPSRADRAKCACCCNHGEPTSAPKRRAGAAASSGATGRLPLPASVPFRYFGAATLFHLAMPGCCCSSLPMPGSGWRRPGLAAGDAALITLARCWPAPSAPACSWLPAATPAGALAARRRCCGLLTCPAWPCWCAAWASGSMSLSPAPRWWITALLPFAVAVGPEPARRRAAWSAWCCTAGAQVALALLLISVAAPGALWTGHPLLDHDSARGPHLVAGVFPAGACPTYCCR